MSAGRSGELEAGKSSKKKADKQTEKASKKKTSEKSDKASDGGKSKKKSSVEKRDKSNSTSSGDKQHDSHHEGSHSLLSRVFGSHHHHRKSVDASGHQDHQPPEVMHGTEVVPITIATVNPADATPVQSALTVDKPDTPKLIELSDVQLAERRLTYAKRRLSVFKMAEDVSSEEGQLLNITVRPAGVFLEKMREFIEAWDKAFKTMDVTAASIFMTFKGLYEALKDETLTVESSRTFRGDLIFKQRIRELLEKDAPKSEVVASPAVSDDAADGKETPDMIAIKQAATLEDIRAIGAFRRLDMKLGLDKEAKQFEFDQEKEAYQKTFWSAFRPESAAMIRIRGEWQSFQDAYLLLHASEPSRLEAIKHLLLAYLETEPPMLAASMAVAAPKDALGELKQQIRESESKFYHRVSEKMMLLYLRVYKVLDKLYRSIEGVDGLKEACGETRVMCLLALEPFYCKETDGAEACHFSEYLKRVATLSEEERLMLESRHVDPGLEEKLFSGRGVIRSVLRM